MTGGEVCGETGGEVYGETGGEVYGEGDLRRSGRSSRDVWYEES